MSFSKRATRRGPSSLPIVGWPILRLHLISVSRKTFAKSNHPRSRSSSRLRGHARLTLPSGSGPTSWRKTDFPIGAVKILLNGRPITGRDLPAQPGDTEVIRHVDQNVELEPGQNSISVLATDRTSRSSSRPQEIAVYREAGDDQIERKPRAFVLAVGISRYANSDFNLDFPHVDATSFAAAWKSPAGKLYEDVQTRLLTNEQATVSEIRRRVRLAQQQRDSQRCRGDFHRGSRRRRPIDGLLYRRPRPRQETTDLHSHSRSRLGVVSGKPPTRRTLVFLDTCHAGGIEHARRAAPEGLRELTSDEVGAVMFGACKPREESQELAAWGHGAFTKVLLETFNDPSKDLPPTDGLLSIDELAFPLGRGVATLTDNEQHPVINRPPTIENFDFLAFAVSAKPNASGDPNRPQRSQP